MSNYKGYLIKKTQKEIEEEAEALGVDKDIYKIFVDLQAREGRKNYADAQEIEENGYNDER